ncbi:MAG: tellurite resistance TerB family protein [Desulfobacteraceae bacterium]|nr:MAG: tellurite resistance TerB family protein [Desulfobacteraceae bacterium]
MVSQHRLHCKREDGTMFNPERLLGGLLRGGMRRGGGNLGSLVSGGAALGLLGVAIEAVEHYMNKPKGGAAGVPPAPAGGGVSGTGPPPVPGRSMASPPPPPPGSTAAQAPAAAGGQAGDAVLLIRAMIAAANADGAIDAEERTAILDRLKSVQLSPEEHQFITQELLEPKSMKEIVAAALTPELARQVYLASLLAITVDTDEELDYLQNLARHLRLDQETLEALHQQAGVYVSF